MKPAAAEQRRVTRGINPFECMLLVFVACFVCLSAVILIVSLARAFSSSTATESDPRRTSRHHHSKDGSSGGGELNTLEVLRKHSNENSIAQSGWLPGVERKRSSLESLNPFEAHSSDGDAQTQSPMRSVHRLDLRNHKRISDDAYYLGSSPHPRESNVELHSYAFVHYTTPPTATRGATDPLSTIERSEKFKHFNRSFETDTLRRRKASSGGGDSDADIIECGAPIAMGARWKNTRGYYVHPRNSGGMKINQIVHDAEKAADTWRCVFRSLHLEPLGPLLGVITDETKGIDFKRPSGDNHIAFAKLHLPDGGEDTTLAVTITHGVYAGPHSKRFIAEFSTVFNDEYKFDNCADPESKCSERKAMDFQSIATHELGHAHGLDDLYSSKCTDATMYWSAQPGETKKRSLTDDDKNSMIALYYK